MRKSVIFCAVLLTSGSVFSQALDPSFKWGDLKKQNNLKSKLRYDLGNRLYVAPKAAKLDSPENKMPIVKIPLKGKYIGNNKAGFDIYAMLPYKMPCLVPDSTFASNMPIKSSELIGEDKKKRTMKMGFAW